MKKLLMILLALALVAAACGGGDDDDDAAAGDGDGDGAASSDDGSGDGSGDDGSGDDGSGDGSGGDGSFSGEGSGDWCSLAAQVEEESFLGDDDFNPFGSDSADLEEAFKRTLEFADDAEDLAPPEISDDVSTLFDGLRQLDDALAEADYNFLAVDAAELESLSDPAFTEASDNIQRYNFEICGVGEAPDPVSSDDGFSDDGDADDGLDELPADGNVGDVIVDSLVQSLGLSEDEARCVVDNLDLGSLDPENLDTGALFGVFSECGIDLTQLGQ